MSVTTIHRVTFVMPEELRELIEKNQLAANDWYRVRDLVFGTSYTGTQLYGSGGIIGADFTKERDAVEADVGIGGAAKYILKRYGNTEVQHANGR
jgi:hypothetical protein